MFSSKSGDVVSHGGYYEGHDVAHHEASHEHEGDWGHDNEIHGEEGFGDHGGFGFGGHHGGLGFGGHHGGFGGGFGGFGGFGHHGGHVEHGYGKSDVPKGSKQKRSIKEKHHKKVAKEESAAKKHRVVYFRPPLIYHQPPEIYHRPDLVVHRPDIVVHRPEIVLHRAPVVVHRPSVVYHQPPVVFYTPPPTVHQPVMHSDDAYMTRPEYEHVDSNVQHVGGYVGTEAHHEVCYVNSK